MTFADTEHDEILTLQRLKQEYLEIADEYDNKPFAEYLGNVLDATLRGRNDLSLLYTTEDEAKRLFRKIVKRWRI